MQVSIHPTSHSGSTGLLLSFLPYAIACVVLSALPLFTYAQDTPPGVSTACERMNDPAMPIVAPPPHPMGMMMLPPLLAHLDLTDEQQDKVFQLTHALASSIYENEKIARKTMQEIQQLTRSEHFDAAKAKSLAETHGKALAELAYLNTAIQSQIWALLTADQRKRVSGQTELRPHWQ